MKDYNIFDIIGPIMIGPSSSHTAGACRIGYAAQKIIKASILKVSFILYESFAKTYMGHGTDVALLGGILGFKPDDERIVSAHEIAQERNLTYEYICTDEEAEHPNTVLIRAETAENEIWEILGISIGGGKMIIRKINGIDVQFTGEFNTLVTHHRDSAGMLASISTILSENRINIAFMKLYREERGRKAIGIIEADEKIPKNVVNELLEIDGMLSVNVIQKIYE